MAFRTRKRGSSGQRGLVFPVRRSQRNGDKYVSELLREKQTHDVNTVIQNLNSQGRELTREKQGAERDLAIADAKAQVLAQVINVLYQIRESGRTRVGDSELKAIMNSVMRESGVPPSAFGNLQI